MSKKNKPWRIVVGVISIILIVLLWVNDDVKNISENLSIQESLPLILTTILVILAKIVIIFLVIYIIKFIIMKISDKELSKDNCSSTTGAVKEVTKQSWLKVNTKLFRLGSSDGATFPHVIKVSYVVDEKEYVIKKWIGAGRFVPSIGSSVTVLYDNSNPKRAKIEI